MKTSMRVATVALAAALLAALIPGGVSSATAGNNPVVRWNEIASNVITSDAKRGTPSASSLYLAIVQAAVYDAVMAFDESHAPYVYDGHAPEGASLDAAVATAAHDVLVTYFTQPAQVSAVEGPYSADLAAIPDGPSKDDGVAVGRAAAAAIVAMRGGDGRDAAVASPPNGTEPGQWRRTDGSTDTPAVTPYVAQVRPFLAQSPDQFRPKGPKRLSSHAYAEEFERTRLYGAAAGSPGLLRTPAQTEIATFWTENTVRQYNRALRGLAIERGLSVADTARMFAMTDIPAADAMITCWNTKYHFLAWRPITAIRLADTDGNPSTTADPSWTPLSATALHPEYVSGHACLTGAITRGLEEFLGTKRIDLTMDSTVAGTAVHHFGTIDDLRTQVEDARVFGGDHWTTGGTDGTDLGDDLAKWALKRSFEAV